MVLTPGVCASSLSGDVAARPGTRIDHPQGDGGNSASLPGESTKDTVKTIRAGKAGRPASPVVQTVCILCSARISGAAGARPSLRPLAKKGDALKQGSGRTCRETVEPWSLPVPCAPAPRSGSKTFGRSDLLGNLELDQAIAPAKCPISRRNDRRAGPI